MDGSDQKEEIRDGGKGSVEGGVVVDTFDALREGGREGEKEGEREGGERTNRKEKGDDRREGRG